MNQTISTSKPIKTYRIVFLMSRLLDGGIDTVLLEYLKFLSGNTQFKITLAIAKGMGTLEVFKEQIPEGVELIYFCNSGALTKIQELRTLGKVSITKKLWDETVLGPIRRYYIQQGINNLAKEADVIIDFDSRFCTFLRSVKVIKIAFIHFSLKERMGNYSRTIKRLGKGLESFNHIVTISNAMKEEAMEYFPNLKEKLHVIYNPKNPDNLLEKAQHLPADNRINEQFILAVERLVESQKDITTLLESYAILLKKYHIEEKLYIIGKGKSEEMLHDKAAELGISDHVVFLGFTPNPYPWMQKCKVLVHSAKFEGLPTVLVEGLMLRKLMVSTDCPTGPKEILNNGKAGILVPVGNARAFAKGVYQLLTDKQKQEDILKGVDNHVSNFTFKTIAYQFYQMLGIKNLD